MLQFLLADARIPCETLESKARIARKQYTLLKLVIISQIHFCFPFFFLGRVSCSVSCCRENLLLFIVCETCKSRVFVILQVCSLNRKHFCKEGSLYILDYALRNL